MKNVQEMKRSKAALITEARKLADQSETEKRDLSAEDKTKIDKMIADARTMDADIAREEALQSAEMVGNVREAGEKAAREFRNFGEYLYAARFNPTDRRLQDLRVETPKRGPEEARAGMDMTTGSEGGVLVPPTYMETIFKISPQATVLRAKATVIPAGSPPDSALIIPTLDQSGTKGYFGGVQVVWIAEGGAKVETTPNLKDIQLFPKEVAAFVTVTDKLLRNSDAASALVSSLLRGSTFAAEDYQFMRGNGTGKPTGIVGHASTININRTTANTVVYNDLTNMLGRVMLPEDGGGELMWIANQTLLPKLMQMVTPLGQLVWQPSAREGFPQTLLGYPLILNQRLPAAGTKGDLILIDPKKYLIKDGSAMAIEASPHVYFTNNKTVIKAFWNVDGMPWLTSPVLTEDGVTTLSPFTVLDVVAT